MRGVGCAQSAKQPIVILTHTLTHKGKGSGGHSGEKRAEAACFLERTVFKRPQKQRMKCFQSVGKDEVSSSNLDSSSKVPKYVHNVRMVLFYIFALL